MRRLHGVLRLLRRTALELLLFAAGVWSAGWPLLLLWTAAGLGLLVLWRKGELQLAFRCPRLDALGLAISSRNAPWESLIAADVALRALDRDLGHFREFFPDARRDLVNAAARALEAQRNQLRLEAALVPTPPGEARNLLERQHEQAVREIARLTVSLRELRARLVASTQPLPATADPAGALRGLEQRSQVLFSELNGQLKRGEA